MRTLRYRMMVAGIVASLITVAPVASGEATPTPNAPPPNLCQAEPRSLDVLNTISATPWTGEATPGTAPEGIPADPETVAGVTATVRELVACFNAGELLRAYGLYTDDYLRRLFWRQPPLSDATYNALATPMPSNLDEQAAILEIRDVRLLPNDQAGATVTIRYAVVPMPKTFFFTFVRAGDRWLIDGILGEISFSVP